MDDDSDEDEDEDEDTEMKSQREPDLANAAGDYKAV